jgi:hypothetical protein
VLRFIDFETFVLSLTALVVKNICDEMRPNGLVYHQIEMMGTSIRKSPVCGTGTLQVGNDEVRTSAVRGRSSKLSLLHGQVLGICLCDIASINW